MCVSQRFCVASPVATYRGLFAVYRELRVAFKATYRELVAVYRELLVAPMFQRASF
jgi:hypothetical protein